MSTIHLDSDGTPNCCRACARVLTRCKCADNDRQLVYWDTEMVMIDPYDGGTFMECPVMARVPRTELEALRACVRRLHVLLDNAVWQAGRQAFTADFIAQIDAELENH